MQFMAGSSRALLPMTPSCRDSRGRGDHVGPTQSHKMPNDTLVEELAARLRGAQAAGQPIAPLREALAAGGVALAYAAARSG